MSLLQLLLRTAFWQCDALQVYEAVYTAIQPKRADLPGADGLSRAVSSSEELLPLLLLLLPIFWDF
jgi:hypothetical protein